MLSPQLLEVLRAWWRQCRSQGWLFPGRDPFLPITTRQLNRACHIAAEVAGLGAWISPHTLRHSADFDLLKSGSDECFDDGGQPGFAAQSQRCL